jgi:16S rRNA G527 N7-methylase RsmG
LVRGKETDLWRKCQLVTSRAMGQGDLVLREAADLVRPHGHVVIYKGPSFAGEEKDKTMLAADELGYRLVTEHRVVLEAGDPERVIVVFCRER